MVSRPALLLKVASIFELSGGLYGSPRITAALAQAGLHVGRRRVIDAMGSLGLEAHRGAKHANRGNRKNGRRIFGSRDIKRCVAPDRLRRCFNSAIPNRCWVTDISDLGLDLPDRYICIVLDLASRRVIGWRCGPSPCSKLAVDTLRQAIRERAPPDGLIVHSDRGGEYASRSVMALLERHRALPSMSRRGNCWDNAVAESFFATLKKECIYLLDQDRAKARPSTVARSIAKYIEWYNETRLHSALGYVSPAEHERRLYAKT